MENKKKDENEQLLYALSECVQFFIKQIRGYGAEDILIAVNCKGGGFIEANCTDYFVEVVIQKLLRKMGTIKFKLCAADEEKIKEILQLLAEDKKK